MKEIILFFYNDRIKRYWISKVARYLQDKRQIRYFYNKKIFINDNLCLHFVSQYEQEKMLLGRHNVKCYYDTEELFEKDFEGTLKEILNG